MELTTFITAVFCVIDDWLGDRRLRQRGPRPTLADSEVLTIECVGEFLGIDTDQGIYSYFRRHWGLWFPGLRRVHRTTFARQAANLWVVKHHLQQHLLTRISHDPLMSLIDSVTVPICRFARAYRCRRLRDEAAWGYDEVVKQTYLGLRVHLQVCWPGVIVASQLTPANISDQAAAVDLLDHATGWALADRNYGSPHLIEHLADQGLCLLAPPRGINRTRQHPPPWITSKRRRIETVIGQLTGRYHLKQVWARDAWHLWSRWLRKILSHTLTILLCQHTGLPPLQFARLVTT